MAFYIQYTYVHGDVDCCEFYYTVSRFFIVTALILGTSNTETQLSNDVLELVTDPKLTQVNWLPLKTETVNTTRNMMRL